MRWQFKWRRELKTGQYYDLLKRGFIKPDQIEPGTDGFEFYLDAFAELSTSRPGGLDIQSIPFTAIAEYFRIYEIPGDFGEFAYLMRLMDREFIELNNAAQDAERKQGEKNGRNNGNPANTNKGRHKR